jgi:hypothetical protein
MALVFGVVLIVNANYRFIIVEKCTNFIPKDFHEHA